MFSIGCIHMCTRSTTSTPDITERRIRWLHLIRAQLAAFSMVLPFAFGMIGTSHAGSFQVTPVRVEIPAGSTVATIMLRNESDTDDVVVQARPQNWTQKDGEDVTTPTSDLVVSPPIFTIKAGSTQIVRIGLRDVTRLNGQTAEVTYRLFLTEVPPPTKPGFRGLQVALNLSIPIFFAPPGNAAPKAVMSANWQPDGKLVVSAANRGNMRLQVAEVQVSDAQTATSLARISQPRYVLPQQIVSWVASANARPAGDLRVTVITDIGELTEVVKPGVTQTNLVATPTPVNLGDLAPPIAPKTDAPKADAPKADKQMQNTTGASTNATQPPSPK